MGKLTFVLIMELFISMLLWLFGIAPLYSQFLQYFTPGTGIAIPNFTAVGGNYTVPPPTTITQSNTIIFGLGASLGIFSIALVAASLIGPPGGFSVIYTIPALIVFALLMVLFSPIVSISQLLLADPALSPLGWVLLGSFVALNGIGIIDFIRGGEL